MNMREPSDLVIIGRIAGDISPLPMEKSGDIITDIISNLMEMTRCCFRMYVSCIVHLNKQEGIMKDLPLDNRTVEVNTTMPSTMTLTSDSCVMVRGRWRVVPDENERYKVIVDSMLVENVDRNWIVKDDYVKPKSKDNVRYLVLDNRF